MVGQPILFCPKSRTFCADMIQITREASIPTYRIPSKLTSIDLNTPKDMQSSSPFASHRESPLGEIRSFHTKKKEDPFADAFQDPVCKFNLKETADFVKSFPMSRDNSIQRGVNGVGQRRWEAPPTPGRPLFTFSAGNISRKNFPSKWDDAEKWVVGSSCNASPAHMVKPPETSKISRQDEKVFQQKVDSFTERKFSSSGASSKGSICLASDSSFYAVSSEVLLEDKFTDNVEPILPNFRYCEPMKEGIIFKNSRSQTMKDAATEVIAEVQHRDIGTEMTPFSSSVNSRCHTPFKNSPQARHNHPASTSGPSVMISKGRVNGSETHDRQLAKLWGGTQLDSVVSNWNSKEEEEDEISKSLRHFEIGGCGKSAAELRAYAWEEEEKKECCIRYQREEAKIRAWVDLQSAKAEAQSKKLEVKIQKMRSKLEEKLLRKMANVHRRAEEMRTAAQLQHSHQLQRASQQAQRMINQPSTESDCTSCGCFSLQ